MSNQKGRDFGENLSIAAKFIFVATQEILSGIFHNRVPARMCYPGLIIAGLLFLGIDGWVFGKIGLNFSLGGNFRAFFIYVFLISGWILWGAKRAAERTKLLNKLRDAFEAARLKCNGRYPALLEDVAIDDFVRKLRLKCHGVPKADFEKETERLEAVLNMTVVRFLQEDNDKSTIEIIYTMKDLGQNLVLEKPDALGDAEIPIGISYEGPIFVNMRDVGHILVAGQTGGGKSNFLKVVSSILTQNNRDAKVIFLDFKGGMETADLRNHAKNLGDNIACYDGSRSCVEELIRIGAAVDERFKQLAEARVSNLDDYTKRIFSKKAAGGDITKRDVVPRTFIIIDEIAQLYSKEPRMDKKTVDEARAAVNRIARQGRASGLHLIVATQKPDIANFDQTVKANLPAVLCFPMVNQVASVAAIGSKRAFELNPNIKGRAVWKYGPSLKEVQTYLYGS